jgi:CBS domain-containing protein
MTTVSQLLRKKGTDVVTIGPQATVFEALQRMADKNIGALLVMENDKLVGVFSERDYARKVILAGRSSKETRVADLMTTNVFFVKPGRTMEDCMVLMSGKHIRHLPVMEDGEKLLGIVTMRDVVKELISSKENTIRELETYISGGYSMGGRGDF